MQLRPGTSCVSHSDLQSGSAPPAPVLPLLLAHQNHDLHLTTTKHAHSLRHHIPCSSSATLLPPRDFPPSRFKRIAMIRLNPTAISLRPSDVKALQAELERRREAAAHAKTLATNTNGMDKGKRSGNGHTDANTSLASSRSRTERARQPSTANNQNAPQPADAAVEDRRRRRAAMSAQQRIGYICESGREGEDWGKAAWATSVSPACCVGGPSRFG